MYIRSVTLTLLMAACSVFAVAPVAAGGAPAQTQSIGVLTQDLERYADLRGVKISDIKISRSVSSEAGIASTSCTATATISIPGGTGVQLSATAPTCSEAIDMLKDAIAEYLEP